jgi:RimJ/RimL family protein N-acetyltransferase
VRAASLIHLEPIAAAHAASLQTLLEDPAIAETTPFPYPYPPDGAETYIAESASLRDAGTKYVFAVCEADGLATGMAMLKDVDQGLGEAELGYWIGKPYWGQGRATAAAATMLDFGFDVLGLQAVRAICFESNPASLRVLSTLGFTLIERFMEVLPKWTEPKASTRWRLTADAWRQERATLFPPV